MDSTEILNLINDGNWQLAKEEMDKLKHTTAFDDIAAIIEAAICEHEHDETGMHKCITEGLKYNSGNYELYVMLGNYYRPKNVSQAYLCYENALFYCDSPKDAEYIRKCMEEMLHQSEPLIPSPVSIVIVSYNSKAMMQNCIQSIRNTMPQSAYEIIVTDNASDDGVVEWLKQQDDIILIQNRQNRGFGYACNQGAKAAKPNNDIFFLNNDTLLSLNAVFWLRMGLYENQQTGAAGSVSNYAGNGQQIKKQFESISEYMEYGKENNIPATNPYERKVWLSGFALLIKRPALDEIGLFDLRFGKGYFEDDDIGIRLRYAGYHLLLCRNSFIFHYGSQSFGKNMTKTTQLCNKNQQIFREKWGFDIENYSYPQMAVLDFIEEKNTPIQVLEIGCGTGMLLSRIKYLFPNSTIRGIESEEKVARLGKDYLGVEWGDAETMAFPYKEECFDYIIFNNILETFYSPEKIIMRLMPYLKKKGKMLFSIFNAAHICMLSSLLNGSFAYSAINVLYKEHIRFFALNDILQLLARCGLTIEDLKGLENKELADCLPEEQANALRLIASDNANFLQVFQYIVKVGKTNLQEEKHEHTIF